jgi:hypothetical protein
MLLDRGINVDHLFAMRAPAQDIVKERAFAVAFVNEIDVRRDERNRDKREIAHIIGEQLELKNRDIPQKPPTVLGTRSWR